MFFCCLLSIDKQVLLFLSHATLIVYHQFFSLRGFSLSSSRSLPHTYTTKTISTNNTHSFDVMFTSLLFLSLHQHLFYAKYCNYSLVVFVAAACSPLVVIVWLYFSLHLFRSHILKLKYKHKTAA